MRGRTKVLSRFIFQSLVITAVSALLLNYRTIPVTRLLRNPEHFVVQLLSYNLKENFRLQLLLLQSVNMQNLSAEMTAITPLGPFF